MNASTAVEVASARHPSPTGMSLAQWMPLRVANRAAHVTYPPSPPLSHAKR